jgi:hypothetical protein
LISSVTLAAPALVEVSVIAPTRSRILSRRLPITTSL